MPCDLNEELICALVDGELPADDTRQLAAHIQQCPRCARLRETFASTKALLRQRVPREDAPAHFWAQVCRRLDALHPPARSRTREFRWVFALAACLAVIVLGSGALWRRPRPQPLSPAELVQIYDTHRQSPCSEGRVVHDPTHGARWLTQTVGYTVPAVNYTAAGYELSRVMSCVCFAVNRRATAPEKGALMAFRRGRQDWCVCLFIHRAAVFDVPMGQTVSVGGQNVVVTQEGDYNVVSWKAGDRILSLVSNLPREELLKLSHVKPCERTDRITTNNPGH
ncbi:MAG: zf-HC2 domain-containing protein [Abditibacteriales bacterium]|nr:zf-HC2 domain-containing protein [Abditibacteriales bacterium]MDW8365514.1 zf-HC2 domain-containing protein [Abditibacteriales bacterium]